jgi:hypothetical protein
VKNEHCLAGEKLMTEWATTDALPASGVVIPVTETADHVFGQFLPDPRSNAQTRAS